MISRACVNCQIKSLAAKKLSKEELIKLQNNCAEVNFIKGDIIFKQGALSSNIVYLKKGLVKVHITGPSREQIINITKAPSYLGIPTTFDTKINHYSATAIIPSTLCFIDVKVFKHFINNNGCFAYEIILDLCRNEINSFYKCVNRTQKQSHGRIAEALLYFSNELFQYNEFEIPLSRDEFGNLTDSSRESVSRILSEFDKDGLIKLSSKKITIINEEKLQEISKNG